MEILRCHINIYLNNPQSKFIYYLNIFAVIYLKLLTGGFLWKNIIPGLHCVVFTGVRSPLPSIIYQLKYILSINRFYFTLRTMLGTSSVGKREEILDMVPTALGDTQLTP